MPTTDQLQTEITNLTARVNAIDGTGLSDPSLAVLTVLAKNIASLNTTLRQTALLLEQQLQGLQTSVNTLQSTLNTHLGT